MPFLAKASTPNTMNQIEVLLLLLIEVIQMSDLKFPWWFVVDADPVLGSSVRFYLGSITNISEVHAACIFRTAVSVRPRYIDS